MASASTAATTNDSVIETNVVDQVSIDPSSEGAPGGDVKPPLTKEKLRSIMEAASALTALADEDEAEAEEGNEATKSEEDKEDDGTSPGKRYIPEHKKPDAALTFPEKVRTNACIDFDITGFR